MKLDKDFAREINRIANGDCSDAARHAFVKKLREVSRVLSTTKAPLLYADCIKQYGRVPIAICTAATILRREGRLESSSVLWAREVLGLWANRPASSLDFALIDDGLHPTRIEEYAGSFMRVTVA